MRIFVYFIVVVLLTSKYIEGGQGGLSKGKTIKNTIQKLGNKGITVKESDNGQSLKPKVNVTDKNKLKAAFGRKISRLSKVFEKFENSNADIKKEGSGISINFENANFANNKEIFESLQQFYRIFQKVFKNEEQSKDRKMVVKMKIGGKIRKFTIKNASRGRLQVFTSTSNDDFPNTWKSSLKNDKYDFYAEKLDEGLDQYDKDTRSLIIQERAKLVLEAIKSNEQTEWENAFITDKNNNHIKVMGPNQIRAAVSLIIATQIAESVPPDTEFTRKLLTAKLEEYQTKGFIKAFKKSGRVSGIDKYARAGLTWISNRLKPAKFKSIFGQKGYFITSHKGGTEETRKYLLGKQNPYLEELEVHLSEPSDPDR